MGAFFAAFAQSLPTHWQQRSIHPDWAYTLDLLISYGYLLWFLVYFFTSNFQNKQSRWIRGIDVIFDVVQSVGALISANALGFVTHSELPPARPAFVITNIVILVICALSYYFFACRHRDLKPRYTNRLRLLGVALSIGSIVFAVVISRLKLPSRLPPNGLPSFWELWFFAAIAIALLLLLCIYVRNTLTRPFDFSITYYPPEEGKTDGCCWDISSLPVKNVEPWNVTLVVPKNGSGMSIHVAIKGVVKCPQSADEEWTFLEDDGCGKNQAVKSKPNLGSDIESAPRYLKAKWDFPGTKESDTRKKIKWRIEVR